MSARRFRVSFPGSQTPVVSPPCERAIDAARWAMLLACGLDPGHLYARAMPGGATRVWTRRHIATPVVRVEVVSP